MSKTVDERVVSLQFDNKDFEKNVSTTMSTLDKFKQKLNFKGTSDGLVEVGKAANKVDMTQLGRGVEAVQAKFSAMQVVATTALVNITNSAMNAGKKIISALTIDPVKTGFQEYETQINAIQTILANTKSKGSTLDDVNNALDELNKYADQTIYNFTEMTRNIGTFTAAGVDLETSTNAIQGIANLAAVSGSTSQQASTAMYQLSQALAAGKVSLMDWNSVVNAGMGGQLFQDALIKTSEELKTGAKAEIERAGSFRESLTKGAWLTNDVLTETLKKFTTSGANEYIAKYTGLTKEAVAAETKAIDSAKDQAKAIDEVSEALAKKSGKSKDAIKESLDFAYTAQDAATKVKTFTQLWDVLKEAAQSGWTQTWELLIGDFEQAKSLLTPIADILTGVINKFSDMRNAVLKSALVKNFQDIGKKIKGSLKPLDSTAEAIGKATTAVKDYSVIVNEIIGGKWGNGQGRWDKLTKAGYDWAHAQNEVNKKLGSSVRHTTKYKEAQNGATKSTKEATSASGEFTKAQAELLEKTLEKTDAELKAMGYTKDEIKALRELESLSEKLNIPIVDLVQNLDELNGRWILLNSFKNIIQPIITIAKSLGKAMKAVFDPFTGDDLFNIIAGFHKFSTYLVISEENAEKLTSVFKGLFAIIDIVATFAGGTLKLAFKIILEVFKALGYGADDILDLAAAMGELMVEVRDWLEEHNLLYKAIEKIIPIFVSFLEAVVKLGKAIADLPIVSEAVKWLLEALSNLVKKSEKGIDKLTENLELLNDVTFDDIVGALKYLTENITSACEFVLDKIGILPDGMASGFISGMGSALGRIKDIMLKVGSAILDTVKDFLGIHSPSTKAIEMMGDFVDGIVIGTRNSIQKVIDSAKTIAEPFLHIFDGVDMGMVFAGALTGGLVYTAYKFVNVLDKISAPAEGLGNLLDSVAGVIEDSGKQIKRVIQATSKVIKSFAKIVAAKAFKIRTEGFMNIAKAVLMMAGALYLISIIDSKKLLQSVIVLGILAGTMAALVFAVNKMGDSTASLKWKEGIEINGIKNALTTIGIAVLLMAAAVKVIGSMKEDEAVQGFYGLVVIVGALALVIATYGALVKGTSSENINKVGKLLLAVGVTMIIMTYVIKQLRDLNQSDVLPAIAFVGGFIVFLYMVVGITYIFGDKEIAEVSGLLLSVTLAMILMIGVIKLVRTLNKDDIKPAATFIGGFILFMYMVVGIGHLFGGKKLAKISGLMLSVSIAMVLMLGVIVLINKIPEDQLYHGIKVVIGFGLIIVALTGLLSLVSKRKIAKVGSTLLGMSVGIGVLALVAYLMSKVDVKSLAKGIIVVGILSVFMAGLAASTENATDCKGSIMAMAVAIGVMAAAILVLSFIDPKKLVGPVLALGILMGMFGLMMKLGSNVQSSMKTLIVMVAAIGVMTAVLVIMSKIPYQQAIGSAVALSILMLAMGVTLKMVSSLNQNVKGALLGAVGLLALCVPLLALVGILYLMNNVENAITNAIVLAGLTAALTLIMIPLSVIGNNVAGAIGGAIGLLALCVPMLAFVGILYLMNNVSNATENAKALVLLMGAITLLMIPLTIIGSFIVAAIAGVIGLTSMAIPMLAFIGILALMNKIENAHSNALLLILLMTTMTGCLKTLALISPLLIVAEIALVGLIAIMGVFGTLATAVGGLLKFFPGLQEMVDKGIPLLISIANGMGEMIGAFVGGIVEQITQILPNVGQSLSDFATNVQPFINAMTNVDPKVLDSVKLLAEAMLILTAVELIEGLTALFGSEASLSDFGTQLAGFSGGLRRFGENVSDIEPEKIKGAATAAKTLAEMAAMIPNEGGLISLFTGDNTLDKFGNSLASFAGCLKTFYNNAVGIEPEVVKRTAEAGKTVIKMAKEIPNEGGLISFFTGDNTMDKFGNSMAAFAGCLRTFYINANGIDVEVVKAGCEAGKAVISMAKIIPNEGGLISFFTGDNNMAVFGNAMVAFAACLRTFNTNVTGISIDEINKGCEAGKAVVAMAKTIPNEGGLIAFFTGDNNMAVFGSNLTDFGDGLVEYSNKVVNVDLDAVKRSADVVRQLVNITNMIPDDKLFKKDSIADFGDNLPSLGKSLKKFYEKFKEINLDDTNKAVSAIKNLANIGKHLEGYSGDGLKNFKGTLKNIADAGIKDFTNAFKNSTEEVRVAINTMFSNANTVFSVGKSDFDKRGKELITSLAKGMESCGVRVKLVVATLTENASDSANSFRALTGFTSAGINMVNGFASGISSQTWKAEAKASAMAQAALDAAKETLDINSPSKEAKKLGFGIPEGLAQGIDRLSYLVYDSSSKMANSALNSTSRILSDIASVIDSDVDCQPTIRPVVDLSNIESSKGLIGGMLGGLTPSLGVIADVNSINGSMNAKLQNGSNNDVISAIEKLGNSLGSIGGGDTYNINGITYDDGSNITNAVSTLVRAARIERRI